MLNHRIRDLTFFFSVNTPLLLEFLLKFTLSQTTDDKHTHKGCKARQTGFLQCDMENLVCTILRSHMGPLLWSYILMVNLCPSHIINYSIEQFKIYLWCERLCRVPAAQRCVSISLALFRARTRAAIICGLFMIACRLASFLDSWCTIMAAWPVTTCVHREINNKMIARG